MVFEFWAVCEIYVARGSRWCLFTVRPRDLDNTQDRTAYRTRLAQVSRTAVITIRCERSQERCVALFRSCQARFQELG